MTRKRETRRLDEPAPNVTVYLVERIRGLWHPVVERHTNCRGMTHEDCIVMQRFVGPGFDNFQDAQKAANRVDVVMTDGKPD